MFGAKNLRVVAVSFWHPKGMQAGHKNATRTIYAGAPHSLTDTRKDPLNADLLAFLKT